MNPNTDTLNISPRHASLPIAEVERAESKANRPEAAEAARARIEALTEPRIDPAIGTTTPIVTDKNLLATQLQGARPSLPLPLPKVKKVSIPSRLQPLAVAVGVFALTLLAFKAPVLINQLKYHQNSSQVSLPAALASAPVSADPTLVIPKINVNAPVVYLDSNDETQVLASLEHGIVHYANTAFPGQNGNAVFFGHSSNDWWEPGDYKFVFVLLDKMTVGDTFQVNYNSVRYTYKVTKTQVVDPTQVSVLNQTATPTATLITCSPPGTSWKRLVISADQIDPAPTQAATTAPQVTTPDETTIPGNAPSWWDQLKSTIGGLLGHKSTTTTTSSDATSGTGTTTLPNVK